MRTDYKIAIAVALFLIVMGGIYFGLRQPATTGPDGPEDAIAAKDAGKDEDINVTDRGGGADLGTTDGTADTGADTGTDSGDADTGDSTAGKTKSSDPFVDLTIDSGGAKGLPGAGKSLSGDEVKPPDAGADGGLASLKPLKGPALDDPGLDDTGLKTDSSDAGGLGELSISDKPRVYVVKEGDLGFWYIAKNVYGDGRHWKLIRDANPGADSNSLRRGQKLTIPPLPKLAPEAKRPLTDEGPLVDPEHGGQIYVVQKGDAGFWGIAQKVYWHGKHWPRIAEANPNVNPKALRIGQRLRIPPLAAKPRKRLIEDVVGSKDDAAAPGTYRVRKGDQGFWGVAQNVYKDGKLWQAIAEANPGVESANLRIGQVLKVPPLAEALKTAGKRPAKIDRPIAKIRDGEPKLRADDFDRPIFD